MKSLIRLLLPVVALALPVTAQTDAIISKARAYLGSESALQALKSVHYKGHLTSTIVSGTGETREDKAAIDIVFAKPYFQRIAVTAPDKTETTALDDYEAWQRIENPGNTAHWQMSVLDTALIRRLRANAWENLSFFKGIERNGGRMEDQWIGGDRRRSTSSALVSTWKRDCISPLLRPELGMIGHE
ncbi:MAG: hypothetical protein J6386_14815 [Candidatus Synoicihabitans palmerolidicus]|nr:hypothetical protein [Candidatus Synoicihabitans palmerolidicus]